MAVQSQTLVIMSYIFLPVTTAISTIITNTSTNRCYPLRKWHCSKDWNPQNFQIRLMEKRLTASYNVYIAITTHQARKILAGIRHHVIKAKHKLVCLRSRSRLLWRYCLWKYYYRILFKWEVRFIKSLIHIYNALLSPY